MCYHAEINSRYHFLACINASPDGSLTGHTPSTAGTFRKKFQKNSGKTLETIPELFLEFPSGVRLGSPKPYNSRHLKAPEHFQNPLPLSTPPPSWAAANGGVTNGGLRGVWPPFLEIGRNRPFSPFFCLFRPCPEGWKSTWKIQKTEEKGLFLRYPQICLNPHLIKNPHLRHSNPVRLDDFRTFGCFFLSGKPGMPVASFNLLFRAATLQKCGMKFSPRFSLPKVL